MLKPREPENSPLTQTTSCDEKQTYISDHLRPRARWLADPRKFIPDAGMPVRVLEDSARRDIVAYLKRETGESGDPVKPRPVAQSPGD